MRNVLISGYYGFQNTGDDALLAAAAWGARELFGGGAALCATARAIPVFPGSNDIRPSYAPEQRVRGEDRLRLHLEALRARSVVFGGGSVFHRTANLEDANRALALSGRGPHVAAGISIGPLQGRDDERRCSRVLSRLSFIGARDPESAELARALAPRVPSALTFDLAPLLLELAPGALGRGERRGIGISVCDYERLIGGDRSRERVRRERLAEVVRLVRRETAEEIAVIDFNGHPSFGDRAVHADIAKLAGGVLAHVPYRPQPLEVLSTIARLRVVVAMRLHAAVFGYLAGTPVVMLSYHPKCDGWATQIGLPTQLRHDSAEFDPRSVADQVLAAVAGSQPDPTLPVEEARLRARANFPAAQLAGG